jgi:hypothetical protein
MRRLGALILVAGGCSSPTTLLVEVDAAAGVEVRTLTLSVVLADGENRSALLNGMPPSLPGRALVKLDDVAEDVQLALDGFATDGTSLHTDATAHALPHQQVDVTLTVGEASGADLSGPSDLSNASIDGGAFILERQITVTNGSSSALPAGYTIRVPLAQANFPDADIGASFEHICLIGPSGDQAYLIDPMPPGDTRALWFALAQPIAAGASDSSYFVHYGIHETCTGAVDGTKVFALWDGFDTGQLASVWLVSGSPTLGGGNLSLHANGSDGVTTTAASDGVPTLSALEWRSRVSDPSSAGQVTANGTFWYWYGYQHTGDFTPSDPWVIFIARAANEIHAERKITGAGSCTAGCVGVPVILDNAFHWYRIERSPAATRFYFDGALSYSVNDPNDTDYSVMLRNWAVTSSSQIDWIRARALATPEPTVGIGAETVH